MKIFFMFYLFVFCLTLKVYTTNIFKLQNIHKYIVNVIHINHAFYSFSRLLKHISWNYASFLRNSKHKSITSNSIPQTSYIYVKIKLSTQNNWILLKNQTLPSDMTHKPSKTHTLMRYIQNNTTKNTNKCCLWYSPSVLFLNLMYCRVQYNTANNNKNNYSAPASCLYWPWPGSGGKILLHAWSNPGTHQLKYLSLLVFLPIPFIVLLHVVVLLLLLLLFLFLLLLFLFILHIFLFLLLLFLLFLSVLPLQLLLFLFLHFFLYSLLLLLLLCGVLDLFLHVSLDPLFQTWIQFFSVTLVHFSNHPYCNICKEVCAFLKTIRTNSTTQWISYKSL